MNRNSYQTYSGSNFGATQSYKMATGGISHQRAPLYPIGPSLPQPEFKPIQRGVSPYISRQGIAPPSYQQTYYQQSSSNFGNKGSLGFEGSKINYEQRQRQLIARNQNEIDQEHKKREQIRLTFQREIASKTNNLQRNNERKQRLLTEIQTLQNSKDTFHSKLMSMRPPNNSINTIEPIDRKQQEMIILKNRLINQMREKESEMHKQEDQQQKFWQNQIVQKERFLLKLQSDLNSKRIQLNMQKNAIEKPDLCMVEDQIRQEKYEDFIFQSSEIQAKINRLTEERQRLNADVKQTLTLKKPQMHNLRLKREDLVREKGEISLKTNDMKRVAKQMEEANLNKFNQLQRNEKMISKYECDIHELRERKQRQEAAMIKLFTKAKEGAHEDIILGLTREITRVQDELRLELSSTNRLKTQYQRLYELLCSATIKNLHQSFSSVYSQEIRS